MERSEILRRKAQNAEKNVEHLLRLMRDMERDERPQYQIQVIKGYLVAAMLRADRLNEAAAQVEAMEPQEEV